MKIHYQLTCFLFIIIISFSCSNKKEMYSDSMGNTSEKAATYFERFAGKYQVNCSFDWKGSTTGIPPDQGSGYIWLEPSSQFSMNLTSLYPTDVALNSSWSAKGSYGKASIFLNKNGSFSIMPQRISIYNYLNGSGTVMEKGVISYSYSYSTSGTSPYDCSCFGTWVGPLQ